MAGQQMYAVPRPHFEGWELDPDDGWRRRDRQAVGALREKLTGQAEGASDRERAERIRAALEAEFGGPERQVELADIFRDDSTVVFWIETPEGPEPPGDEFLMSRFQEDGGRVTVEEPTRVVRRTVFEPVQAAGNAAGHFEPVQAAGNIAAGQDPIHRRALEILDGLSSGDRMAVLSYAMAELKRVGACGRTGSGARR